MKKALFLLFVFCCCQSMSCAQDQESMMERYRSLIRDSASFFTAKQQNDCFQISQEIANTCFIHGKKSPSTAYNAALLSKELYTALVRVGRGQRDASQIAHSLQAKWSDIQTALPEQACAVEFVDFEKNGQTNMGAIVLSKRGNPVWVDLTSPDSIYECPVKGLKASKRIFGINQQNKNELYFSSNLICSLLWPQSLVDMLKDKKEVFFSPANYQHLIAIEYVVPKALEHIRFHRLSSTRKLMEEKRLTDTSKALICGGINYNNPAKAKGTGNDTLAYDHFKDIRGSLKYLPGSLILADSIRKIRQELNDLFIDSINAEESDFLYNCQLFPYIFITTHGLFIPDELHSLKLKHHFSLKMLSHSAIMMSGTSVYQKDTLFQKQKRDGLLSAKEFNETDLSNVDLFVLSTCNSGLGYLTDDGVYGLRKGLQLAGVRCVMSTLWELDDYINIDFMSLFNIYLSQGHTPDDAIYLTRKDFMKHPEYGLPQYFDVFIVVDGWQ